MSMDETAAGQEAAMNPDDVDAKPARTKRAIRGFGYVYRRGRVWWIRYSHRGRDHREPAGSARETDAYTLADLIEQRWRAREYEPVAGSTALSAHVFHRDGRPVSDFRKAWASACESGRCSRHPVP
jgi:hypothetical protein